MNKLSNKKEYFRLDEISEIYNINLNTLRRWAWQGKFPVYKISRLVRVSKTEFDNWWKNKQTNG